MFSISHNSSSRLHWGNRWMGTVGSWGLRFWDWGRQWSYGRFVDFVIGRSWSCWTVDELANLELLTSQSCFIEKLSAVFASNSLLELGGDECDNLNFKNDSFKIPKKSRILGTFKIRKIRIPSLCLTGMPGSHTPSLLLVLQTGTRCRSIYLRNPAVGHDRFRFRRDLKTFLAVAFRTPRRWRFHQS